MTRIYKIDGKQKVFSRDKFKEAFDAFRESNRNSSKKPSIQDSIAALAEKLKIGYSTVENWYKGKNGPTDIPRLRDLAAELKIDDCMLLLEDYDGGSTMYKLSDRQKDACKRIYDVLVWYVEDYLKHDGYLAWCEDDAYSRTTRMQERVQLVLNQESFDLYEQDIYYELYDYALEELFKVYSGKNETDDKRGLEDVWEKYAVVSGRLNMIVQRIV